MPRYTLAAAARLCRVARSTLHRAWRSGRLTRGRDGLVDTAELIRAGYLAPSREHDPPPPRSPPQPPPLERLEAALNRLEALTNRLEALTHPPPPRRTK